MVVIYSWSFWAKFCSPTNIRILHVNIRYYIKYYRSYNILSVWNFMTNAENQIGTFFINSVPNTWIFECLRMFTKFYRQLFNIKLSMKKLSKIPTSSTTYETLMHYMILLTNWFMVAGILTVILVSSCIQIIT